MTPGRILFLAVCAVLLTGCATYRGWMRPDPSSRSDYLVPVPDHGSVVVVSAPPGWHLDPEGGPIYFGSFIHPNHFLSRIVVATRDDHHVTHESTQAHVYSRVMEEARRSERGRLDFDRQFRTGFPPFIKLPLPVSRDPVSYRVLKSVLLRDRRRVWASLFHSPTQGYFLKVVIPENDFVVTVEQCLEDSKVPGDLLAAIITTVESYRLRPTKPHEFTSERKW